MSSINTEMINKMMSDQKDKAFLDQSKQVQVANLTLAIFHQGLLRAVPVNYHGAITDAMNTATDQAKSHVYQYNTAFTSSLPAPPAGQFAIEPIDEDVVEQPKTKKPKLHISERPTKYTACNHFNGTYVPVCMRSKKFTAPQAMSESNRLWQLATPEMKLSFLQEAKGICAHHDDVKPSVISELGPMAGEHRIKEELNGRYKKLDLHARKAYFIKGNKLEESAEVILASATIYPDYDSLKAAIETAAAPAAAPAAPAAPATVDGLVVVPATVVP